MPGQNRERNGVFIGSAFAIGLASGFLLKDVAMQLYKRARAGGWRREYERTVVYDQNLPEQLERREPEPQAGQPRYGGTGALGVPPERAL